MPTKPVVSEEVSEEDKLLVMFEVTTGKFNSKTGYAKVVHDDDGVPIAVNWMSGDSVCWTKTKADIVFDYVYMGVAIERSICDL